MELSPWADSLGIVAFAWAVLGLVKSRVIGVCTNWTHGEKVTLVVAGYSLLVLMGLAFMGTFIAWPEQWMHGLVSIIG